MEAGDAAKNPTKHRTAPPSRSPTQKVTRTQMWLPQWLSGKEPAYQCKRCRFNPWVGKILWRRKWQHTPVFLPGKSYGQRSLAGYSQVKVTQLCLTLCDTMDCSLPGSSIHGIFQARVLEWVAISFSRGSSRPRDWTQVSRIVGRRFTSEPPGKSLILLQ